MDEIDRRHVPGSHRYWLRGAEIITLALGLLLAAIAWSGAHAAEPPCDQREFAGSRFLVCSIDPKVSDLRLFWQNPDGDPHRSFSSLASAVADNGRVLRFAMNAGMYDTDFAPIGLYVEDGEQLRPARTTTPANLGNPVPNFYKTPNGIFYLSGGAAGIVTTESFVADPPQTDFATQSGPMLVIDGVLNPIFIPDSSDRTRRSGVGTCTDNRLAFAISEGPVNFHDFGRLFRDALDCPNALFLDGGRGVGLYDPALGRNDFSWHGGFGPMIGLVE